MKVILLEDVKDLGRKFDAKDVSDGYARNFLIPRGLAKAATPRALTELGNLKTAFEKEDEELKKHLTALAQKFSERSLTFFLKTNEEGKVFGSVTKDMILKGLREHNLVTKERVEVHMTHPLKELGEHEVEVGLKKGIAAKLKVILQSPP